MRMSMRRFTRLTNAFSKKIENECIRLHCSTCITTSYGLIRPCGFASSLMQFDDPLQFWEVYGALQRLAHFERHQPAEALLFRFEDFRRAPQPAGALGERGSPVTSGTP